MSLLMATSKLQAHVCMCVCMLYACVCMHVHLCAGVCVCMGLCVYMHVAAVGWGVYVPLEIKGQP